MSTFYKQSRNISSVKCVIEFTLKFTFMSVVICNTLDVLKI